MSTGLRQRRLQGFNNVAAGFMPAINAFVKGVPASSRRRPTSCFCCREFIRTVVGTLSLFTNILIGANLQELILLHSEPPFLAR